MKENWKDIIGYEGLYQIYDHGRIKSGGSITKVIKGRLKSIHGLTFSLVTT